MPLIPHMYGDIEEAHDFGSKSPKLFFIQDAHDSLEAQENIGKLIHYLVDQQQVNTVFEEGYEGKVPTDEYFKDIKNPTKKGKISYFLMDQLRLGGAEYAHINRLKDFQLFGVDNRILHARNLKAYQDATVNFQSNEKELLRIEREIKKLAQKKLPEPLKQWMKLREKFDRKEIDFIDYLGRLQKFVTEQISLGTFQKEFPNMTIVMSSQSGISENEKMNGKSAFNYFELFKEIYRMDDHYVSFNSLSSDEQKIYEFYKAIQLIKKLNHFDISAEEYQVIKQFLKEINTGDIAEMIVSQTRQSIVLSNAWESNIKAAMNFYEIASLRDEALEESMLNLMAKKSADGNVALVFGGFHKEKIKNILIKNKISYVVINPKITELSLRHQEYYRQLMGIGHHPYEVSFMANRAAKANPVFNLPFGRNEIMQISHAIDQIDLSDPLWLQEVEAHFENLDRAELRTRDSELIKKKSQEIMSLIKPFYADRILAENPAFDQTLFASRLRAGAANELGTLGTILDLVIADPDSVEEFEEMLVEMIGPIGKGLTLTLELLSWLRQASFEDILPQELKDKSDAFIQESGGTSGIVAEMQKYIGYAENSQVGIQIFSNDRQAEKEKFQQDRKKLLKDNPEWLELLEVKIRDAKPELITALNDLLKLLELSSELNVSSSFPMMPSNVVLEHDLLAHYQILDERLRASLPENTYVRIMSELQEFFNYQDPFTFKKPRALTHIVEILFSPYVDRRLGDALNDFISTYGLIGDNLNSKKLKQSGSLQSFYLLNELHKSGYSVEALSLRAKTYGKVAEPDAVASNPQTQETFLVKVKNVKEISSALRSALSFQFKKYIRAVLIGQTPDIYPEQMMSAIPDGVMLVIGTNDETRNAEAFRLWYEKLVEEVRQDLETAGIAVREQFKEDDPRFIIKIFDQPLMYADNPSDAALIEEKNLERAVSEEEWVVLKKNLDELRADERFRFESLHIHEIISYFSKIKGKEFVSERSTYELYLEYLRLGKTREERMRVMSGGDDRLHIFDPNDDGTRSEMRSQSIGQETTYQKLESFFRSNSLASRQNSDGTLYVPTPLPVVSIIHSELERRLGKLSNKRYLSFGAGGLVDSLAAAALAGMQVTAIEKDQKLFGDAEKILQKALNHELIDPSAIKLIRGDAFGLSWAKEDIVFFFYTQSGGSSDIREQYRSAFEKALREKISEMKPGSIIAFLFTGTQLMAEQDDYGVLKELESERIQISDQMTGLYLDLYRIPTKLELENQDTAMIIRNELRFDENSIDISYLSEVESFFELENARFNRNDLEEAVKDFFLKDDAGATQKLLKESFKTDYKVSDVLRLDLENFQYGEYFLIFKGHLTLNNGEVENFIFVAPSPSHAQNFEMISGEYELLKKKNDHHSEYVVKPYLIGEGRVRLDAINQSPMRIPFYVSEFLSDYVELNPHDLSNKNIRFYLNASGRGAQDVAKYQLKQDDDLTHESIMAEVIKVIVQLTDYDEASETFSFPSDLNMLRGDFMLRHAGIGNDVSFDLKLIALRSEAVRVSVVEYFKYLFNPYFARVTNVRDALSYKVLLQGFAQGLKIKYGEAKGKEYFRQWFSLFIETSDRGSNYESSLRRDFEEVLRDESADRITWNKNNRIHVVQNPVDFSSPERSELRLNVAESSLMDSLYPEEEKQDTNVVKEVLSDSHQPAVLLLDANMLAQRSELQTEAFAVAYQTQVLKQFKMVIYHADQFPIEQYKQFSFLKNVKLVRGNFREALKQHGRRKGLRRVHVVGNEHGDSLALVDAFLWKGTFDIWGALIHTLSDGEARGIVKMNGVYQLVEDVLTSQIAAYRSSLIVQMSA